MSAGALQAYYAARAADYDSIYAMPERQEDLRSIAQWLGETFRASRALEVACGTGYWTRVLSHEARQVLAVDAAAEVLTIAKGRDTFANTTFVRGDAYRLPVNERRFDAAFAGFWISHVPLARVREFLAGLHRALEPGARIALLDNRFVEGNSTPISETDADGNTYQSRTLRDGSTHRVLKNFPTERDLRMAIADCSREVRFRQWRYYWSIEYRTL